jgi:hypothetical protein
MGEDNKKSFWTSLPGILSGIAAVITAVGTIIALHPSFIFTSPAQAQCGAQIPGVALFGSWRWEGINQGVHQRGLLSFYDDCAYTNVPEMGFKDNQYGHFLVTASPPSITFTYREPQQFLITNISENSFHGNYDGASINFTKVS